MVTSVSPRLSLRPRATVNTCAFGRRLQLRNSRIGMDGLARPFTFRCNASTEEATRIPSWTELEELVASKGTELGDPSLTQEDYLETGPTNPYALKRTFGKKEPIRVKLYRDSAAWCPFCQRVWIQLEEKQVPYIVEKIMLSSYGEKPESFMKISPKGQVPVMELDGKVVLESDQISELIEAEFPETPLIPPQGTPSYERFKAISQLTLPFSGLLKDPKNPEQNEKLKKFCEQLEAYLTDSKSDYLLNEGFSLADIRMITLLDRFIAVATYYSGIKIRNNEKYPGITRWFELMENRPCYAATQTDYFTAIRVLKSFVGEFEVMEEAKPVAEWVDGKSGLSLPLEPLSSTSLEPYSPGDNPAVDTYEAGKRLIQNHEAVVKFALKGGRGQKEGEIDEDSLHYADEAFRTVAQALVVGVEEVRKQEMKIPKDKLDVVVSTVEYLRNHVCVPRDLKLPAARQLRAHMNWMLDRIAHN